MPKRKKKVKNIHPSKSHLHWYKVINVSNSVDVTLVHPIVLFNLELSKPNAKGGRLTQRAYDGKEGFPYTTSCASKRKQGTFEAREGIYNAERASEATLGAYADSEDIS